MSFLTVKNVAIRGISVSVPKEIEEEIDCPAFPSREEAMKFIQSTGIERHRIAPLGMTASDMGVIAAKKLLAELCWDVKSVDCLIFVTQTPDYILPFTASIIQDRIGLATDCYATDISAGCPGWVYGLGNICSLIGKDRFRRGLLICGDTLSRTNSAKDKSSWPLFSDATSVTAVEYNESAKDMYFNFGTDGGGYKAIYIPEGGYRQPFNERSLEYVQIAPGICKNRLHGIMDGMEVFSFAISRAPKSVKKLAEHYGLDYMNTDYLLLHQANEMINTTIARKLKYSLERVPSSLKDFGNTSAASIPITIIDKLQTEFSTKSLKIIACAFGVGLSWGSVYFETSPMCCSGIIEI